MFHIFPYYIFKHGSDPGSGSMCVFMDSDPTGDNFTFTLSGGSEKVCNFCLVPFLYFYYFFIITVASFNFSEDQTFQFEFVKMILFFRFRRIIFTVTEPESGVEPK